MNIEQLLTDAVVKAVKACYDADINPEPVSYTHLTLPTTERV